MSDSTISQYQNMPKEDLLSYLLGQQDRRLTSLADVSELICEVVSCNVCPVTQFKYAEKYNDSDYTCCRLLEQWLIDASTTDFDTLYRIDYNGTYFVINKVSRKNRWVNKTMNVSTKRAIFFDTEEGALEEIEKLNELKVEEFISGNEYDPEALKVCKCNNCKKYFILPYREYDWFIKRNMSIPKKCKYCRHIAKQNKNKV